MRFVVAIFMAASSVFAASSIGPVQLRCEYRRNPQGIDVVDPRLSWELTASDAKARGLRQTAYRILATALSGDVVWDTGKVSSTESAQVVYSGKPLGSGMLVSGKVQVGDQSGQARE